MRGLSRWLTVVCVTLVVPARTIAAFCPGDCDGDDRVSISEMVDGVICVLHGATCVGCCEDCLDLDGDGVVTINEIIAAVNHLLNGCPE